MKRSTSNIVTGYVEMWPRELFSIHKGTRLLINDPALSRQFKIMWQPGVYILYRDEYPYYVGQASGRLFSRLHDHANKATDRYYLFWNFFSAFSVPRKYLDEIEAMLIATVPTANSASPKLKPERFPKEAGRILTLQNRIEWKPPRITTEK